jgi:hypothetical protein
LPPFPKTSNREGSCDPFPVYSIAGTHEKRSIAVMSTRSIIAVAHGDVWAGVSCHMDGYPTWQGPRLWATFQVRHGGDIAAFEAQELQAHPGGYSGYPDACYCHAAEDPVEADEEYYTPEDEETCAVLMEWVYVFSRRVLTVLKSVPTGRTLDCTGPYGAWRQPIYRWSMVQQIDLQGTEPDWEEVEERGKRLRDEAHHSIEAATQQRGA